MSPFFRGFLIFCVFWGLWLGASLYALAFDREAKSPRGEHVILYATEPCFRKDIPSARLAEYRYKGQLIRGCWVESDGQVYMAFEDGDQISLPATVFTQVP